LYSNLDATWQRILNDEINQPALHKHLTQLAQHLHHAQQQGLIVYPPEHLRYRAFALTPFKSVKVVILGQDPYHQPHQAMGLSFSVPQGSKIPPSLRTIYRELARTLPNFIVPTHGDLSEWATQGVLLLNAILTVTANQPASHAKWGWTYWTDAVIRTLSAQREHLVFMLWGKFAQSKAHLIDATRHLILTSAHPSPLAQGACNPFIGCNHFQIANDYLVSHAQTPIDWQIHQQIDSKAPSTSC
jgi:uracil-DNA glycosylase